MSFASRYLSEIQSGKGLIGAAAPAAKKGMKDLSKQFSRDEFIRGAFSGDDILSTFVRGKLGVDKKAKKEKDGTSPTKMGDETIGGGISQQGLSFLKVIARSSLSIPGIARDMNVMRQNLQKLVKLRGGEASTGADAFFLKQAEREAALEAQTANKEKPAKDSGDKEKATEGGFFSNIIKTFSTNFLASLKSIFSLKNILKFLSKAGPIALIGAAIFSVFKGWEKAFETGSFKEGLIEGFGTFLELLTFGLLGPDTVASVFENLESFFKPLSDAVTSLFEGLKSFVKNTFGRFIDIDDSSTPPAQTIKPGESSGEPPKQNAKFDPEMSKAMLDEMKQLEKDEAANAAKNPIRQGVEKAKSGLVERHKKLAEKFSQGSAESPEAISREIQFIKYKKEHFEHIRDKLASEGKTTQAAEVGQIVNIYENRMSELLNLKVEKENQQKTPTQVAAEPPAAAAATASAPASPPSAGASGGTAGSAAPSAAPSSEAISPPATGAAMSEASSLVAEGQRMESAADAGTFINAPVTNSTSGQMGKQPKNTTSAYNDVLAELLTA